MVRCRTQFSASAYGQNPWSKSSTARSAFGDRAVPAMLRRSALAQAAAIEKSQAVIECNLDGTIVTANSPCARADRRSWQRPTRQEVGFDTQISPPVQPLTLHP